MKRTSTIWGASLVSLGIVLLIAMSLLWGLGVWGPGGSTSAWSGVEAGSVMDRHFLEEMIPHHEDAVAMAELARTRAEHPELKELAETIIRDQTREIEQMRAWYRSWYGTEVPEEDSGPRRPGRGMMGMMDGADLEALENAPTFDTEFIEQMVPHHQMAVMMARMLLARTERPELRELGRSIISTQSAEIEQMREMYREWTQGGA